MEELVKQSSASRLYLIAAKFEDTIEGFGTDSSC